MEAICSAETSVDIQRTTRRYIPEDSTFQTDARLGTVISNVTWCRPLACDIIAAHVGKQVVILENNISSKILVSL
jgi:hypothetical protein